MESIKELRRLLQEEKVNPTGWKRPWGYKTFQRGPSIYITRLLLPTRITPTQVTITGISLGLVGCAFLLKFDLYWKFFGLFLLYMSILADKVDGEIARYKNIYSLKGIFLDEISHLIIPPLMWLALALGIIDISIFEERFLLIVCAIGALALMANRVVHSLPAQIYAKKFLKHRAIFQLESTQAQIGGDITRPRKNSILINIIRPLHQLQDFFTIIAAVAIILVFERVFLPDYIFHVPLTYFILIASALFVLFALENIIKKSHSVEQDILKITSSEY